MFVFNSLQDIRTLGSASMNGEETTAEEEKAWTSNAALTEEETTDGNIMVQGSAIKLPATAFSSCSSCSCFCLSDITYLSENCKHTQILLLIQVPRQRNSSYFSIQPKKLQPKLEH